MRNLIKHKLSLRPPFVKKNNFYTKKSGEMGMLYVKLKNITKFFLLAVVFSSVLFTANTCLAAEDTGLFSNLLTTGSTIFTGMREIVFAVSGFGIVAVAVGAFFGNLNWKWLSAIMIGLVVISTTAAIINYMTEDGNNGSFQQITDTLVYGNDSGMSALDQKHWNEANEAAAKKEDSSSRTTSIVEE
ncbi:MAG: TrbC/VirB2 family protein [Alphaproteobacteria bacterium]|nr:TrbC/VirB2 family protein [Alphaproteobacteria bacterium]